MAKDAVENQPSAREWGQEAIRLIYEDGHSVEAVIEQTKRALGWHHMGGLIDSDAKRSKFFNYFSTVRYLTAGWLNGTMSTNTRDAILRGDASFLSIYASQKKLEKEEVTSLAKALDQVNSVRSFANTASPSAVERLRRELIILLDSIDAKSTRAPSSR
jgi:hypothetical protein